MLRDAAVLHAANLRAVAKDVAELVVLLLGVILELDAGDLEVRQIVKLACLGDAVVILVLPEAQRPKD